MIPIPPKKAAHILDVSLENLSDDVLRRAYVTAVWRAHPDGGGGPHRYSLHQLKEARRVLQEYMESRR